MVIRIEKPRHSDREATMTCIRDDATATGQRSSDFFIGHDLTHYAVETSLGFRQAFFGLVLAGRDLDSFSNREEGTRKAARLPEEAYVVENIVAAFDLERASEEMSDIAFCGYVAERLKENDLPQCPLLEGRVEEIRKLRDDLLRQWGALLQGERLELQFPNAMPV